MFCGTITQCPVPPLVYVIAATPIGTGCEGNTSCTMKLFPAITTCMKRVYIWVAVTPIVFSAGLAGSGVTDCTVSVMRFWLIADVATPPCAQPGLGLPMGLRKMFEIAAWHAVAGSLIPTFCWIAVSAEGAENFWQSPPLATYIHGLG